MKLIIIVCMILSIRMTYAQKPILQADSYKAFTTVDQGTLSENGKYASYRVNNLPRGRFTTVIMATDKSWKREYFGLKNPKFSSDSRHLIGVLPGDTLLIFDLINRKEKKMTQISEWQYIKNKFGEYIAYRTKNKELIISKPNGLIIKQLNDVGKFVVSPNGIEIILISQSENNSKVFWTSFVDEKVVQIYDGTSPSNFIFDDNAELVAFTSGKTGYYNYYISRKYQQAEIIPDSLFRKPGDAMNRITGSFWGFSKNGKNLYFSLSLKPRNPQEKVKVIVADYRDQYLKSNFYGLNTDKESSPTFECLFRYQINDKSVSQITQLGERIAFEGLKLSDKYQLLLEKRFGATGEFDFDESQVKYEILNLNSDKRILLPDIHGIIRKASFSPSGSHLVYWESKTAEYYSFNIVTGAKVNIGKKIPETMHFDFLAGKANMNESTPGIVGWDKNGCVFLQSTDDIFSYNVNTAKVLNVTDAIGKANNWQITSINQGRNLYFGEGSLIKIFDRKNKKLAITRLGNKLKIKPSELIFKDFYIEGIENGYAKLNASDFIYSSSRNYLVRYQLSNDAPNYYFVENLKNISKISDEQPQRKFNWLTTRPLRYLTASGKELQATMFIPENFDSTRAYPVIIHYYTEKSDLLNAFPDPQPAMSELSIALMVSRGYIVVEPDIFSTPRKFGENLMESINAVADHLNSLPFIDNKNIAITGGSYGGYETNYIVTHTNRFKVAVSNAGMSNLVEFITDLNSDGSNGNQLFTKTAIGMVDNFYDNIDLYIQNSPIFYVSDIKVPILFVHNSLDGGVNVNHSKNMYLLLRRLRKPAWWINYYEEGHSVIKPENRIDLFEKVSSFYDCYLKNKPVPEWMERFISLEKIK